MLSADRNALAGDGAPILRKIELEAPWQWLAAGWRDLWARPGISLFFGLCAALAGALLALLLSAVQSLPLLLPMAAGFLLLGPLLAVGLYETSRRLQEGLPLSLARVLVVSTVSPSRLGFLGALLMIFFLAWVRFALLLFALFFGAEPYPPLDLWAQRLLFHADGLLFLLLGTGFGGVLAFLAFSLSAISVPLLMRRDVDVMTAVLTSLRAVALNPWAMLLWAWLLALLTGVGLATGFLGLIVTFPLSGHATWHAYRALVEEPVGD